MTNEMYLKDMKCPSCGNADRLFITATVRAEVTDAGADIADECSMHWADDSLTICPECDQDGLLAEFRTEKAAARSPEPWHTCKDQPTEPLEKGVSAELRHLLGAVITAA